jgi:hypothetical protein
MKNQITPIFIFSLPRSGSTLLQRIITLDERFATTPETWFLLSLLGSQKDDIQYSVYSSNHAKNAMNDLLKKEQDIQSFRKIQKEYINNFYSFLAGGRSYFVEKTPRNYWICEEIFKIFGDRAKYIFLWRNPADIASSMIDTWGAGYWNLYSYESDFKVGIKNLVKCYRENMGISLELHYDEIVNDPEMVTNKLADYLDIKNNNFELSRLSKNLISGKMGDPTGQFKKKNLEQTAHDALHPILRQKMFLRIIKDIKDELELMGYPYDSIKSNLMKQSVYSIDLLVGDILKCFYGTMYKNIQPFILKKILMKKILGVLR